MSERTRVLYEVIDGVAVLTLDEPPANCYSYELMQDLDRAILRARMDDDAHVLLLTGGGDRFFCAGADIEMLKRVTPEFKYNFCLHANETLNRLESTSKLVIAAIGGHCVGGGLEIAMAADLRIARAGTLKLGLPEVSLGVLPGTGGTQRLARLIGKSKAMELMVTGENFSVDKGKELGLIHAVLETEDFRVDAIAYAQKFCPPAKASFAVGLIKRSVQSGLNMAFEPALALERELQQQLFKSEDAKEGLAAFVEKREPKFQGR